MYFRATQEPHKDRDDPQRYRNAYIASFLDQSMADQHNRFDQMNKVADLSTTTRHQRQLQLASQVETDAKPF
ncbi:hypothetical protein D3C81_2146640 [compost metagenome]